ncbi:MAG: hypothetical protein JXR12_05310 [Neptunomonas phycophila]|uniref:hypothetical protein n=1 Tax=Neptunomonas phycophila TaxID=1572645 RepID=UPI003B8CBBA5
MKFYQSTSVDNPNAPEEIANKEYVDSKIGEASGSFAAPVFITDVTNGGDGIVGDKQYLAGTVPANVIVTEATTDDNSVTISVMAEGGSFYSPQLIVRGNPALPFNEGDNIPLTQDSHDIRTFHGQITLSGIDTTTEVTIESSTGSTASANIIRAADGPTVVNFNIGPYPGTQVAARENQQMQITGVVDNNAESISVHDFGAAKGNNDAPTAFGDLNSAGAGYKTFTTNFTVGSLTGEFTVQIQALNQLGTAGNNIQSDNAIFLDQRVPQIQNVTIEYPNGQSAIKGTEDATIVFNLVDATESEFSVGNSITMLSGNFSGSELLVVESAGNGDKTDGTNLTITARRADNDTETTVSVLVKVVDTVPTLTLSIAGNPTRLTSSPTGEQYTVYIDSDLDLDTVVPPSISAPSGSLSSITQVNSKRWQTTLTVEDINPRGVFDFFNISAVSLSGVVVNSAQNTSYTVGGFSERTLAVPLFDTTPGDEIVGRTVDMGVEVGDPNKLNVTLSGVPLTFAPDTNDAALTFTVVDAHQGFTDPYVQVANYDPNGYILYLNDRDQAGANTTGTMTVTIREDA